MYSDLYVVYLIFNNDHTSTQNGWIGKSTDLSADKVYIVRNDNTQQKQDAIKTFFSKRSAHQFCKDVEQILHKNHSNKNITAHVQTKLLPVKYEDVVGG